MKDSILLGAVAYDPKVVTIWDGFRQYFADHGLPFDYVLFSNYEQQVESHLAGQVNVAWNSPLAWIQARRGAHLGGRRARAVAMRDTDQDLTSVIVVRGDSPLRNVEELRDRTVAVGAADSPQASLIPLLHLAEAGLEPNRDFRVAYHDVLVGKHGDHIGGERDAARALVEGRADAACMIDGNHLLFAREGTLTPGSTRILTQTGTYDHCNFTVLDDAPAELVDRFTRRLLEMSYENPTVRPLLDLEGLKAWKPGRVTGYSLLERAVDRFGAIDTWMAGIARR